MRNFQEIKSPAALAAFGAFFVPEPLGTCFVLAAAVWWLCRRSNRSGELLLEISGRSLDFYGRGPELGRGLPEPENLRGAITLVEREAIELRRRARSNL